MVKILYPTILFLLFLFSVYPLQAQSVSDDAGNVALSRTYRKASADSVRLRKEKVVGADEKEVGKSDSFKIGKGKNVKKGKTSKKSRKATAKKKKDVMARVDSLAYKPLQYALGDRVIMRGDSGRDVRSVAVILVNKLYMSEDSVIYTQDGGVLYDGDMVRAIKHFQEFNDFYPDGIIGRELIKALRKRGK